MSRRRATPAVPPSKADSTSAPAATANAKEIASAVDRLAARGDKVRKPPLLLTGWTSKRFFGIDPPRRGTARRVPFQPHEFARRRTKALFPGTGGRTPGRPAFHAKNKFVPFPLPEPTRKAREEFVDAGRPENRM